VAESDKYLLSAFLKDMSACAKIENFKTRQLGKSTSTPQHPTPQHLNTSTPQHFNTSTLQHLNTSTLQHFNTNNPNP
jgi:hypothetical protein